MLKKSKIVYFTICFGTDYKYISLNLTGGTMKGYVIISLLMSIFLIFGCSAERQADIEMDATSEVQQSIDISADMLTTHTDLVCGMDMRKHTITDTTIYKDQLYGFCGSHCKEKFLQDPEAAIAKLEMKK
jgi:YHS domain-containing protein